MTNEKLPQLILTLSVLAGFFATVIVYMFAPIAAEKLKVMELIMTSQGTACLLVLGWWAAPAAKPPSA